MVTHRKLPCAGSHKHRHPVTFVCTLMSTLWPNTVSLGPEVTHRTVGMDGFPLTDSPRSTGEKFYYNP